MASYAEYPPTMPPHDFDLYPSQDNYNDMMPTSQSYMPNSFMDNNTFTTFESQQPLYAYSNATQSQDYRHSYNTTAQQMKHTYQTQTQTPSGSPHSASHSFDMQPPNLSASSESGASVSSSALGSPSLNQPPFQDAWGPLDQGLGLGHGLLKDGFLPEDFSTTALDFPGLVVATDKLAGCVDPTLIQPFPSPMPFSGSPYPEIRTTTSPHFPFVEQPPSPAPSQSSARSQHADSRRFKQSGSQSPFLHTATYQPYAWQGRRPSVSSIHSRHSTHSHRSGSYELDEESREKGLCPIPECGRVFKDLKAHMLTHQNERPEKCPIVTCEYHMKGFARKYDKNRHTLTHYKGTMVCGFCPGSGSAAEKSFNRADVFKRHLTSVHGVEQSPPNSRKKSPASAKKSFNANQQSSAGTCSTCSATFANPQDFYEHLDDCVLRVVQQADPSEAINQKLLSSVAEDKDVKETLERHYLPTTDVAPPTYDEAQDEEEDEDDDDTNDGTYGSRTARSGKGSLKSKRDQQCQLAGPRSGAVQQPTSHTGGAPSKIMKSRQRAGLTYSKGGVAISASGRKKRKHYPMSWGCSMDKMKMKKRVLCVYDGPRRLWKDDMMLDQEFEVRIPLPDGQGYVTDLDVQTINRADALHAATEEEKGPWTEHTNVAHH